MEQVTGDGDDTLLAELRLALQVPRLPEREISLARVVQEAADAVSRIRGEQAPYLDWRRRPPWPDLAEGAPAVRPVSPADADTIHRRFHYIGSSRDGWAFGLYRGSSGGEPPATLLTFSEFDLEHFKPSLPGLVTPGRVLVLSRVYSFRWAPPNAFSYALKRTLPLLRDLGSPPALLLTYINPNAGFTGASYLAANWCPFATEEPARYDYLDGRYITRRELARRFGTADEDRLRAELGPRYATSELPLVPLEVMAYPVSASLRSELRATASTLAAEPSLA